MIAFEDFKKIVFFIEETYKKQDAFLEAFPAEFRDVFFENAYTISQGILIDKLIELLLGPDLNKELAWYLFDRPVLSKPRIETDKGVFMVYNILDFFSFIELEYYGK